MTSRQATADLTKFKPFTYLKFSALFGAAVSVPLSQAVLAAEAIDGAGTLEIVSIDPPEKEFFSKRLDFHGIPIKAPEVVADEALYAGYERLSLLFTDLLSKQPMLISNLVAAGAELHIIGRDQVTTDLPEWRHDKDVPRPEYNGLTRDQRTRGMGGLLTSCGEENLLKLERDRYRGRDICLHEFSHNVLNNGCPREMRARVAEQHKRSLEKELWQKSYAGANPDEFFAELTMWYFGTHGDLGMTGPKPQNGRDGLKQYDPEAFALLDDFYSGRIEITKVEPRRRRGRVDAGATDSTPAVAELASNAIRVSMHVDAARTKGELKPIWRFFGADEPNYAYMKHGRKLVAELGELRPGNVYFRTHNLLTSGDGTSALKWGSTGAFAEDASGQPIYNWTILDRIFDTYLERGVRPYVQIGFMPKDLSIKPEPYQHKWTPRAKYEEIYTGWAYPPKNYDTWRELVFEWTKHSVEKYGRAEVESWYWEVWNEANIGYWRGTPEEFRKLHDYAIDGVRRALPTARVGGADTAGSGGRFTRDFLEHCLRGTNYATGKIGTPLDFISFHAKGAPLYTNDHVRMGIAAQLRAIEDGFRIVASYPELKTKPIVIGESDPEGCAACEGPQLAYRNGTMYSSYTAAVFAREHDLAEKYGVNLEGALTWAFEFEDQPYFAGFRSLASNGIDKPVLNVFRMFSRMSGQRLAVESDYAVPLEEIVRSGVRSDPDVFGLASLDKKTLCALVWHYHDDDLPGPAAEVELVLSGLPLKSGKVSLQHWRIDEEHSNAFAVWQRLGSPQRPTSEQYSQLEKAGQLTAFGAPESIRVEGGKTAVTFDLPRQAVSLLQLKW